jgi:SPW repeat
MMWHKWTKKSFIDVMKLGCAILLTAAPWIFGLDRGSIATWNAWLNGSAIALIAVAALMYEAEWDPETTLGVGLGRALTIHHRIHARHNCHIGSRIGRLRDRRAGSCKIARR